MGETDNTSAEQSDPAADKLHNFEVAPEALSPDDQVLARCG